MFNLYLSNEFFFHQYLFSVAWTQGVCIVYCMDKYKCCTFGCTRKWKSSRKLGRIWTTRFYEKDSHVPSFLLRAVYTGIVEWTKFCNLSEASCYVALQEFPFAFIKRPFLEWCCAFFRRLKPSRKTRKLRLELIPYSISSCRSCSPEIISTSGAELEKNEKITTTKILCLLVYLRTRGYKLCFYIYFLSTMFRI